MILAATREEFASARAAMTGRVAVVMTLGALHVGHAALLRAARERGDHVVTTIFVNPLQFGPQEDFARYPRTLDADVRLCQAEGVDTVFCPDVAEVYPSGEPTVRVSAGRLGAILEGAHRPGHFDGVLTVVLKLFNLIRPELACFGEKDYQQLVLIRHMVRDFDLPVEIHAVATVREPNGLARSSRNRYLSPEQRAAAGSISRALGVGASAALAGSDAPGVLAAARRELAATAEVVPDYLELTDPNLGDAPERGPARLLAAARIGSTRLIDNLAIELT